MMLRTIHVLLSFVLLQSLALASTDLAALKQNQTLADFRVDHLYSNGDGVIVAAKFWHIPSGAPVFLLQLETLPQVLTWVNGPTYSDRGVPHSLEHLLITKGAKGRYLNLLENMRLGRGGAETSGDFVCYGLSAGTGRDDFFEELHALLDALYRPDFTDAEAEREFYHFAVADMSSTKKSLIESGTVYDEQLSVQGQYTYIFELFKRIFGEQSSFGFNSGGEPDAMREVKPEEIRRFHRTYYHIGSNTGFIFSIPPREDVADVLQTISHEFQQFSSPSDSPSKTLQNEPRYPIHPSQNLDPGIYPFPGPNEAAPGYVHFAWVPARIDDLIQLRLLELFAHALAVGEDSLLYKALIDSKTRAIDFGATGVDSALFLDNSPSFPVVIIEVSGIPGNRISTKSLGELRAALLSKIKEVSQYPDGSSELTKFNQLIESYATSLRRSENVWAKNPPGFDAYPPKTDWKQYFERLEMDSSFIRSLSREREWQAIDEQLKSGKNVWRRLIDKFHLLETPYVTASAPSRKRLDEVESMKKDRVSAKVRSLMDRYHTNDDQEALSKFEQQELVKTKGIDAINGRIPRPHFTDHPPMTPDDEIRYTEFQVEGVPVVASVFNQPPTIDIGLSFDLTNVPRKYFKYLTVFPQCLDSLGLKKGEQVVPYSELITKIQRDVFGFSTRNEVNPVSHRADLAIRASAANLKEFRSALDLIQEILNFNYLEAGNVSRLSDIVTSRIASDVLDLKRDSSVSNAGYGFRYREDQLYFALNSRFTVAHFDNRLQWLLHEPVSPTEITKLDGFAKEILPSSSAATRQQLVQRLDQLNANGLEKELVDYWKGNLWAFPEPELTEGLRQLTREVEDDLRTGPIRTIDDLRTLQKIILDRGALHVDLAVSQPVLEEVRQQLASFLRTIPTGTPGTAFKVRSDPPLNAKLEHRYHLTKLASPLYVGFVNPNRAGGDVIFSADFPGYSQVGRRSLIRVLASGLFAGAGPQSFQIRTLARGLAYHNVIFGHPPFKRIWYYADRIPDVPSLVNFVNETASTVSELHDPALVDYALSQTFSPSRSGSTFSERATAIAQDIRDGNEPAKVRRFSEAILQLRKDPDLLSELISRGLPAICTVLLRDGCKEQQQADRSLFFFQGSEETLSDIEKRLPIPKLLRLWPSDYWLE